jgi:hypothetical protein
MAEKNIQKSLMTLLKARIKTIEEKNKTEDLTSADVTEILRIKAALDDKPVVDIVMNVIAGAMQFLHHDYPLESDDQFQTINDFVDAYWGHVRQELLSKASTYKDGLAMSEETS